jgi:tRNA threonylcarbamoyladenosine biosynthesis protein TsaB
MALILSIETSEKICSVALSDGTNLIGTLESVGEKSHASQLTLLIDKLLILHKISFDQLSAVAVSKGPGSYTGLRIGVSTAKGICYGLNIPLIGVCTLNTMSESFLKSNYVLKNKILNKDVILCPMIDARRMEIYRQFFNIKSEPKGTIVAEEINSNSFSEELKQKPVYFFGSGAEKIKSVINNDNAYFVDGINPHASYMIGIANSAFIYNQFEDVAYFEPYYLKDFVATVPKKKVLSF